MEVIKYWESTGKNTGKIACRLPP